MQNMQDTIQSAQPAKKSTFWGSLVKNILIVTACTAMGAGIGWGTSKIQQPQWRSTIKFEAPTVVELGNYYSLATTYALVRGDKLADVEQEAVEKSYAEFKRNLVSADLLKKFLLQSDIVKQQASVQNLPIDTVAQQLIPHFQLDEKHQEFNVTMENPENAKALLSEFIIFINVQTRTNLNNELVQKWKVLFQQVKQAAENNLGTIQTGEQVVKQDWAGKLNLMRTVSALDNKLVSFRVVQFPSTPKTPFSPDNALWAMIGALTGLVIGLFGAVFSNFRRKS